MKDQPRRRSLSRQFAWCSAMLTLVCMFGFPKAGVYLGTIPLTLGYALLGIMAGAELVFLATNRIGRIERSYVWLTLLIFTLGLVEMFSFSIYGSISTGALVSIVVSTLVVPFVAVLGSRWMIRVLGISDVLRALRWALVPVFIYGIFSFAVYNTTGKVVGIPFLTTTGNDLSLIATRHNLRGPFIKMFSTYNNGNILGVNLLLWGPIAALASAPLAFSYRTLCVLTLSRSVWVGLLVLEFVTAIVNQSMFKLFRALVGIFILLAIGILASWVIGRDPFQFLFDRNLGGRVANLQDALEVISTQRIAWRNESVYAASYLAFGPVGLFLISTIWWFPVFAGGRAPIQQTARIALFVYLIIAAAEGAFTLVPTQGIYWFVATIALCPEDWVRVDTKDEAEEITDKSTEPITNISLDKTNPQLALSP
ncbi:hypothetical protein [Rubripirellula reticaptiva]|uniref:Uncharacterized protein n=1 Tax=Rubripirellula reticaptiva TaxID=2528013 RepID=A0A5C6EH16_9BACT|nr:hypothetical protein [Rubripirellula reticaptiva]TWU48108.1 hypothetical protein Poly59_49530 [Rubripirellula reticaptiva]